MEDVKNVSKKIKIIFIGLILLVIVAVGFSLYLYKNLKKAENPEAVAKAEIANTINAVSKLMVLPTNETPTAATVSDPEKLRAQPFFMNALAGDRVLLYTASRKAILYRPSINKIIEVAPAGAAQ